LKLVLFDCDGTLVDSGRLIHEVMARTFVHHGLERPHYEKTKSIIGLTLDTAIARILGQADVDDRVRAMTRHYKNIYAPVRSEPEFTEPMFEGIAEMLAVLEARHGQGPSWPQQHHRGAQFPQDIRGVAHRKRLSLQAGPGHGA